MTGRGRPASLARRSRRAGRTDPRRGAGAVTDPGPPALRWLDPQLSPQARRAVRLLAVADTAKASSAAFSSGAAAALLDATAQRTRSLLDELLAVGALCRAGANHYRYTGQLRRLACRSAERDCPRRRATRPWPGC